MQKSYSIWVLEDDPGSRFVYAEVLALRYNLSQFGSVKEFAEALRTARASNSKPDLVVADLRLPDDTFLNFMDNGEGKELMQGVQFVVVSSVDDIDALRFCFSNGAVDYITKPFGKSELVVKVERLFSSNGGTNDVSVDLTSLSVVFGKARSESLTSKEFQIMSLLQQNGSSGLSRAEIVGAVWGTVKVSSKAFDVHLFNLRRKLAPLGIEVRFSDVGGYVLHCPKSVPAEARMSV